MKKAGRVTFKLEGLNLDRLLKKLSRDMEVMDIKRETARDLQFSVAGSHKEKALAIMNEKCYTVCIVSDLGASALRRTLIARAGLIFGALVAVAAIWLYSSFIWSVNIEGNSRFSSKEIIALLEEEGIQRGSKKSAVNLEGLELKLSLSPLVSSASVKIDGSRLVISITEVLDYTQGIDPSQKRDIYTQCDGIVREILVLAGTARVEIGSVVKAGDILIEGITESGEGEQLRECWALGTVKVSTFKRIEKAYSLVEMGLRRTGNSIKVRQIFLYAKPYGTVKTAQIGFEHYETEVVERDLFNGSILPFKEVVTTYYECERYEIIADAQQKKARITELLTQQLLLENSALEAVGITSYERELNGLILLELYLELIVQYE